MLLIVIIFEKKYIFGGKFTKLFQIKLIKLIKITFQFMKVSKMATLTE